MMKIFYMGYLYSGWMVLSLGFRHVTFTFTIRIYGVLLISSLKLLTNFILVEDSAYFLTESSKVSPM